MLTLACVAGRPIPRFARSSFPFLLHRLYSLECPSTLICINARNDWLKILPRTPLCHLTRNKTHARTRILALRAGLMHLLRAVIGSLDLWSARDIAIAGNGKPYSQFPTCNSPILERFSNGKGSPWIWLENVNCGSTGKAVGTCERQDQTRRTSTHMHTRQDWFYHYLQKSTTLMTGSRETCYGQSEWSCCLLVQTRTKEKNRTNGRRFSRAFHRLHVLLTLRRWHDLDFPAHFKTLPTGTHVPGCHVTSRLHFSNFFPCSSMVSWHGLSHSSRQLRLYMNLNYILPLLQLVSMSVPNA